MSHEPESRDVTRIHLSLAPADLRPGRPPAQSVRLERRRPIDATYYRALYQLVGEQWLWRDRLAWSDEALAHHLERPDVHIWVASIDSQVAGYFELQKQPDDDLEIVYFGLAPNFMGQGIGGWLLTRAAEESFALGARHVVLNTCTLDAPQALPNYLARGFRIVREERYMTIVPSTFAPRAPRG
jgi:ribosomal protein S18 acetylase RimI-like enzyme